MIDGPNPKKNLVEVWSSIRLPFEPRGRLLEMRNSIRSAIKGMQITKKTMLHALYVSDEKTFCDVENVLLYNVGTGAFANICRKGLCIERKIDIPQQPHGSISKMLHYHKYSLIDFTEGPLYWAKELSLASWKGIPCPELRGNNKPHSFWYAIKKAKIDVIGKIQFPRYFGVELKINAPQGTSINLASVIKPLLDGIVCAFHTHNGDNNSVVVGRLSQYLKEDVSVIENMLMDQETGIFGIRNLLHPFGKGVQWNPGDDFCIVAKILLDDCSEDSKWSLDGDIFTVVSCRPN